MFPTLKTGRAIVGVIVLASAASVMAAPAKSSAAAKGAQGDVTRAQMKAQTKQIFDRADTNKDGFMDQAEFNRRMGAVLNRTPPGTPGAPTKESAQKLLQAANAAFRAVDTNRDGKVSLSEASVRPLTAFDKMDLNHDGVLTAAEKLAVLPAAQPGTPVGKLAPGR